MTIDTQYEHVRRGFLTRFNELAAETEKPAMAAAAKAFGGAAVNAGKNLFAKAAPFAKNIFSKPQPAGMTAFQPGLALPAPGQLAAPAAQSLLQRGIGAVTQNPVKALAGAGALGAAGAGTAVGVGAHNYYGQQAQNMLTEMPKAVSGYMASQGAGPGMGGFVGKLLMFLQYLLGGQNANRNLAGSFSNYAKSYPGFTGLNQQQFAKAAPTFTTPPTQ